MSRVTESSARAQKIRLQRIYFLLSTSWGKFAVTAMKRRSFLISTGFMFSASLMGPLASQAQDQQAQWDAWDAEVTPAGYFGASSNPWGLESRLLPTLVRAKDGLRPGDIHVDAVARYLYHIQRDGTAMRYGVAIGRAGLYQAGTFRVGRKAKWPAWTPTAQMISREPEIYAQYADGMPPGPANALGSRAFYLYQGSRDTYLRIHGTPFPRSIGQRASSGCVRMIMPHINDLYESVEVGVTAYLYPAEEGVTAPS